MPFSSSQVRELKQSIEKTLASRRLNDWERRFLRIMKAELDKHGQSTSFSPSEFKQLMKLTNVGRQHGSTAKRSHRQPARRRTQRHPRRRSRRSPRMSFGSIVVGAGLALVAAFFASERFPEYAGPLVSWTSVSTISGRVTHVRDGDTIEVQGVPIRFGSLDCAEQNTAAGRSATRRMRSLVSGQRLECFLNGRKSYDRKIGSCRLKDGNDLAAKMIRDGFCRRFW